MTIRGAGGGGGDKQHTATEAPDSLHSVAFARVLDLISEGEVFGPTDAAHPLRSIFLNETPIENPDGTTNFKNLQLDYRTGTQTQDYIKGFESTENEIGVGVELTYTNDWEQSLTNLNVDSVRILLSVSSLLKQDTTNGDTNGYSVGYAIDVNTDGGGFVQVFISAFTGKTTSKYERSHLVHLPRATIGWIVRVRRLTVNATVGSIQDKTYVESYAEIIDAKLRYPMSAMSALVISAEQFNSIPSRAFDWKGRLIRIPTNYDPDTRLYTGIWDGTFKTQYSNNPSWIFFDMATNWRYGLGHLVSDSMLNVWELYRIGKYCDEFVSDGFGGTEPRFTANLYLQSQQDATKVMLDLASMFRGIMYYGADQIIGVADMPQDPIYNYTNANVIDGKFEYSGSDRRVRHTVVLMSWNDLSDFGRAKVEYVEDVDGIARYGIRQTEVVALGCTSRGQARRAAKHILLTERYEGDIVGFTVPLDGALIPQPGKIITVSDSGRAGKRMGGRVLSATTAALTLDDNSTVTVGDTITIVFPNATLETRTVGAINGANISVNLPGFSVAPAAGAVWIIQSATVNAQTFRVLGVEEKENGTQYAVSCLEHNVSKYDAIELGLKIQVPPIVADVGLPAAPTNLTLTATQRYGHGVAHNYIEAYWDHMPNATRYATQWRKDDGPWSETIEVRDPYDAWEGAFAGTYIMRAWGINARGFTGKSAVSNAVSVGDPVLPIVDLDIVDGVLEIDCRFSQFRLLLDRNVTKVIYTNVAPQDTILIEVTIGGAGSYTLDFGASVTPASGLPYVPSPAVGATDILGLTTTNTGATWYMTAQLAGTLVAAITPEPAAANATDANPSVAVTVNMTGGTGPYTAVWTRTDATAGDNFGIANATTLNPTFTLTEGTGYLYRTQTWAVLVTDTATGYVAQASGNIIFERLVSAGGGGTPAGFNVTISGTDYGSCVATGGSPCSPATTVTANPTGATGPFTYLWTRVDSAGGATFANDGTTSQSLTVRLPSGSTNISRTQSWNCEVTDTATGATRNALIAITLERTNNA